MLTETQIYSLVNEVMRLECSQNLDLTLIPNGITFNQAKHKWTIRFESNHIRQPWLIEVDSKNKVNVRWTTPNRTEASSELAVRIDPSTEMISLEPAGKEKLTEIIYQSGNNLATIIQIIIVQTRLTHDEHNKNYFDIYPDIEDYINPKTYQVDAYVKEKGGQLLSMDALGSIDASTDTFRQPLSSITHADIDIYGRNVNAPSKLDPLYHLMVNNGTLTITRYTKEQDPPNTVSSDPTVADDETAADLTRPKARLSNHSCHIDLSKSGKNASDLIDEVTKAIDNEVTIDDNLHNSASFTSGSNLAIIGYMDTIKKYKYPIQSADKMGKIRETSAYGIDDFMTTYRTSNLDVRIAINADNTVTKRGDTTTEGSVTITYSAVPFGTIAVLHIKPATKEIVRPENLKDAHNLFIIPKDSIVQVEFMTGHISNSGANEMTTFNDWQIFDAFMMIRSLIALCGAISDIDAVVKTYANTMKKSRKTLRDDMMAYVTTDIRIEPKAFPQADVNIKCRSNTEAAMALQLGFARSSDKVMSIKCSIITDPTQKRGSSSELYNTSINPDKTLYNEGLAINQLSIEKAKRNTELRKQGKTMSDEEVAQFAKRNLAAKSRIGGQIADYTFNDISVNASSMMSTDDHPSTTLTKLSRFNPSSVMGKLLLNVKKAINKTFGENFVGSDSRHHSEWGLYFSDIIYATNKKIRLLNGKGDYELVTVLCSFDINDGHAGTFSTVNLVKGPAVFCEIDGVPRRVDPLLSDGTLSEPFLTWYLGTMFSSNAAATEMMRAIDHGYGDQFKQFLPYLNSTGKPSVTANHWNDETNDLVQQSTGYNHDNGKRIEDMSDEEKQAVINLRQERERKAHEPIPIKKSSATNPDMTDDDFQEMLDLMNGNITVDPRFKRKADDQTEVKPAPKPAPKPQPEQETEIEDPSDFDI